MLHDGELDEFGRVSDKAVTTIEHLELRSACPHRTNDYTNCFYTCRFCNGSRLDNPLVDTLGRRLLDPTVHAWADHFEFRGDELKALPGDNDAKYTEEAYDLDDPRKTRRREWRRTKIEESLAHIERAKDISRLRQLAGQTLDKEKSALLSRTATALEQVVQSAYQVLQRFQAIPTDANRSCKCHNKSLLKLPPHSEEQSFDVNPLDRS